MFSVCVVVPLNSGQLNLAETLPSVLPPVGLPPLLPWRINRTMTATHDSVRPGSMIGVGVGAGVPVGNGAHPLQPGSTKCNHTGLSSCLVNHTRAVLIDQSNMCTPQQDAEKIQCLRELPAESYEVLEGEDVQMRCRVAHQRGKAQWRARNFLLGESLSLVYG
ncbi:unnamed protein product [Echinostoma caproni]|uniref:Ig-like domain-containing protein n=1 Tax=Echinostoma caproni TaxID=27848 RepID=A0A183AQ08_9TREM|nr:unnamed protein product [Echinostoma caproni]